MVNLNGCPLILHEIWVGNTMTPVTFRFETYSNWPGCFIKILGIYTRGKSKKSYGNIPEWEYV